MYGRSSWPLIEYIFSLRTHSVNVNNKCIARISIILREKRKHKTKLKLKLSWSMTKSKLVNIFKERQRKMHVCKPKQTKWSEPSWPMVKSSHTKASQS